MKGKEEEIRDCKRESGGENGCEKKAEMYVVKERWSKVKED